jgi:SsrA-binding protein
MPNLIDNKTAKFNYTIQDNYEAGVELLGMEVKSIKTGRGSLLGSYVVIRGGEAFLLNCEIPPYQVKNMPDKYDPRRPRKLLLTKKELKTLADFESDKGLTLVPISMYNKGRNIKLSFAVARGKKLRDKRQTIKSREADREINRSLKKLR